VCVCVCVCLFVQIDMQSSVGKSAPALIYKSINQSKPTSPENDLSTTTPLSSLPIPPLTSAAASASGARRRNRAITPVTTPTHGSSPRRYQGACPTASSCSASWHMALSSPQMRGASAIRESVCVYVCVYVYVCVAWSGGRAERRCVWMDPSTYLSGEARASARGGCRGRGARVVAATAPGAPGEWAPHSACGGGGGNCCCYFCVWGRCRSVDASCLDLVARNTAKHHQPRHSRKLRLLAAPSCCRCCRTGHHLAVRFEQAGRQRC
jgi:hypothetical protein